MIFDRRGFVRRGAGFFCIILFLTSCGGMICEGVHKSRGKQTVVFDYDPIFKTVDVGGAPTYAKNNSWVKKIIVKQDGFVVVTEQQTAGFKNLPCEDNKEKICQKHVISSYYIMQSYKEGEGYKYWFKIPKKDWMSISSIEDQPSKEPSFHAKDCRYSFFGSLLEILIGILRV